MGDLIGADFRAVRRLSLKATPDETLAYPGETCERVPVQSLAPLLASGTIVPLSHISEAEWADLGRPDEGARHAR